MKEKIYYLRDNENIPVIAVGLFQKEDGDSIMRAIAIRSNKDNCSKKKARELIYIRLKKSRNIFPSAIIDKALARLSDKEYSKIQPNTNIIYQKVDLDVELTPFECYIFSK